jgi:pyruvate/2-oxoglutarate dehydrogenase complex dihydrolipoamide acyltransferase (E2) component
MIFKKSLPYLLLLIAMGVGFNPLPAQADRSATDVESSMPEDELDTVNGLSWAGNGWRFSRLIEVQDGLLDTPVGRIVIDRYGADNSTNDGIADLLIRTPFLTPEPGKFIVVSIWGSKIEGCYAEVVLQYAATAEQGEGDGFIPTKLEMAVGGQLIELSPQAGATGRYGTTPYSYTQLLGGLLGNSRVQNQGNVYTGRHLFAIDATIASVLSNAPVEDVKARITFRGGGSRVFPIGKKTVERWRGAYAFNPYCVPPGATPAAPAPAAPAAPAPPPQSQPRSSSANPARPAAASAPAASSPPRENRSSRQRTVGATTLVAAQTLDDVEIQFNGATVSNSGSFITNFAIANRSSSVFGFVPVFASVEDASGQPVTAKIKLNEGENGMLQPGAVAQGQVQVINHPWNESGTQGLVLVVKEGTTGGRVFRMPF